MSLTAGSTKRYQLRRATSRDSEELFRIHGQAMGGYLTEAYPDWSEAADREHHEKWIQDGRAQVILVGDRIAGSYEVVRPHWMCSPTTRRVGCTSGWASPR